MGGQLDIAKPEYDLTFVGEDGEWAFICGWDTSRERKACIPTWKIPGRDMCYPRNIPTGCELIRSLDYTPEQAASNGDIVNVHGKLTNSDKWTKFVEQVRAGNASEAHITAYTVEGDPIFQDLLFDGQVIQYTYNNVLDGFGSPTRTISFCKNLDQEGLRYSLSKCDDEKSRFVLEMESGE